LSGRRGNEQRYRLDFKEERRLWDAIERMYMLEPTQRTVSNFTNIVGELACPGKDTLTSR